MNLTEFLFNLALLVISFTIPVATTFVVTFLKEKTSNEKWKKYLSLAETAVKAAEETYKKSGQGAAKKAEVEKYLAAKIGNVLTAEDIDKLIQAAVAEINKAAGKIDIDYAPFVPQTVPFVQPVNPFNPVTYTTSNTTVQDIKEKAAPDIPSPTPTGTVADPTTQAEYVQAVNDVNNNP